MDIRELDPKDPKTFYPGLKIRYIPDDKVHVIRARKDDDSGWWLEDDAGGIGDRVWTEFGSKVWEVVGLDEDEVVSISFDPDDLDPDDVPGMVTMMRESNETRVHALEEASGNPGSLENAFDALKMIVLLEQIAFKLEIGDIAALDFEGRRAGMLTGIEQKFEQMKRARDAAERQARLAGGGGPLQGPRGMPRPQ